jgi:hypothetical protein
MFIDYTNTILVRKAGIITTMVLERVTLVADQTAEAVDPLRPEGPKLCADRIGALMMGDGRIITRPGGFGDSGTESYTMHLAPHRAERLLEVFRLGMACQGSQLGDSLAFLSHVQTGGRLKLGTVRQPTIQPLPGKSNELYLFLDQSYEAVLAAMGTDDPGRCVAMLNHSGFLCVFPVRPYLSQGAASYQARLTFFNNPLLS